MRNETTIGIDVSKDHLDVAILTQSSKCDYQQFRYTASGQKRLLKWLDKHEVEGVWVCLEATGNYSLKIAHTLHEAGYQVHIANPFRTKSFADSLMLRQKTDKSDAQMLAQYARAMELSQWTPPRVVQSNLRDLKRLLDDLQEDYQRAKNRAGALSKQSPARRHLEQQVVELQRRIKQVEQEIEGLVNQDPLLSHQFQLLMSINGIGAITAKALLAEIPNWSNFDKGDKLASFAGLSPQVHKSGNSLGYTRVSKQGRSQLRKAMYLPALSAMRWNPHLKRFADRLTEAGKAKMEVVVAVMRKLLVLAHAILKSGQPYDPNYQIAS